MARTKTFIMKLFVITTLPQVYAKTRVNINKIHLSYNTGNFAFEEDDTTSEVYQKVAVSQLELLD